MRLRELGAGEAARRLGLPLALAIVVFALFATAGGRATSLDEFPLDDAWIHQVYARGLLRDGAPTYEPGVAEAGFSSLTWLFAQLPVALFARLSGLSPVVPAKLVSLLFAVVAARASGRLARGLGATSAGETLAVALTLLAPGFAFAAMSAMEVTLAAACLTWGFCLLVDERPRAAAPSCAAWAFALAAATRLEALVVVAIAGALVVSRADGGRARAAAAARFAYPTAIVLGAWASYDLAVTGRPLPNTFYVKAAAGGLASGALGERARFLWEQIALGNGLVALTLVVVLVVAALAGLRVAAAVRARARARADRRLAVALALLAAALLPCLAMLRTHALQRHLTFAGERYFLPFVVLLAPLVALGVEALARAGTRAATSPRRLVAARLALVLALALAAIPGLRHARASYAAHCADTRTLHTEPARWIAAHAPAGALVAVEGAGASRYFGEHPIVDMVGLNDHALARAARDEALSACLVAARGPRFLVIPKIWRRYQEQLYRFDVRATFHVDHWSVADGTVPRTVVLAEVTLVPEARAYCARYVLEHPTR